MNTSTSAAGSHGVLRIGLHLLLAALPLLAISAHVFGLVTMNLSAALLILPLAVAVVVMSVFSPRAEDRVIVHGFLWGMLACAVYDAFRLDTVYMLGWWADFIPTMGTWITGTPDDKTAGAVVGYLWRYIGDGGGIGIAFFVAAATLGLHDRPRRTVVLTAVGFAVFPVWAGLIATVAIAPRGQRMMFPLTPTTLVLSLVGHLIFGLIMGLGFWRSRSVQASWPWEPVGRFALREPAAFLDAPTSLSFGSPGARPVRAILAGAARAAEAVAAPAVRPAGGAAGSVVPSGGVAAGGAASGEPSGVPGSAVPGSAVPGSAVPGSAVPASAVPASAVPASAVPASASSGFPAVSAPDSGPVVVPPPPLVVPGQHAGPVLPVGHPSGPQPVVGAPTGSRPATSGTGSFGVPAVGSRPAASGTGSFGVPATGSRSVEHPSGPQPVGSATGSQRVAGARTGEHRSGARPDKASSTRTTAVPRAAHTPPSGETMGPDTWELWQHQLATTVKGRRTHRWR